MTDPGTNDSTAESEAPPRVLALGASAADVASRLATAGFMVQKLLDLSGLPDDAGLQAFDAIIMDLTPAGLTGAAAAALAQRLDRLPQGANRPFVLGITEEGAPAATVSGPVNADAWAAPGKGDRGLLQIEGGVAIRRLAAARREIDRLRRAVLHARRTAHDLAQPLTTVLARSQLLLRHVTPDDPNHRALTILCTEADRLARTVEAFQTLRELAPLAEPGEHQSPSQPGHHQKAR
jgi:signal transduction histidine kinase